MIWRVRKLIHTRNDRSFSFVLMEQSDFLSFLFFYFLMNAEAKLFWWDYLPSNIADGSNDYDAERYSWF